MIPKEWRDYKWEVRPIVVLVFILVSPAMAMILLLIWSAEEIDWPAWVQAVGSVIAIFVAVGISSRDRRAVVQQREQDARALELGRCQRLYTLLWEAKAYLDQFTNQWRFG